MKKEMKRNTNISGAILDEMLSDDSATPQVKSAQIRRLYKADPQFTDSLLIALTGWSYNTLEDIARNRVDDL